MENSYYKRWLAKREDGTPVTVETYTEHAQVLNADGTLAKLLHPSIIVKKTARKVRLNDSNNS